MKSANVDGSSAVMSKPNLTIQTRQALEDLSQFDVELYETFRGQTAIVEGME